MEHVAGQERDRKNRHGMTISSAEVDALLQLFRQVDRGGDLRVVMKSEPARRFSASWTGPG